MGVSKVKFGQNMLIDLTGDTVVPEVLKKGYTAHGANGELIEGDFAIKNQSKNVTLSTTTSQIIKPDAGYDGLSQVTVPAIVNQEKTVNPSTTVKTVIPDAGKNGLSKVTVNPIKLEFGKTVKSNITSDINLGTEGYMPSINYDGFSSVEVEPVYAQEKTVNPSTSKQIISPDSGYDALLKVTVPAIRLQSKSITPSNSIQTIYPDSGFDGLYAVSVAAINGNVKSGTFTFGATNSTINISVGFVPDIMYIHSTYGSTFYTIIYDKNVYTDKAIENVLGNTSAARTIGNNSSINNISNDGIVTIKTVLSGQANQQATWYAIKL